MNANHWRHTTKYFRNVGNVQSFWPDKHCEIPGIITVSASYKREETVQLESDENQGRYLNQTYRGSEDIT